MVTRNSTSNTSPGQRLDTRLWKRLRSGKGREREPCGDQLPRACGIRLGPEGLWRKQSERGWQVRSTPAVARELGVGQRDLLEWRTKVLLARRRKQLRVALDLCGV